MVGPSWQAMANWIRESKSKLFSIDRSPGAMTNRARTYFMTSGLRHGITGVLILALPWLFSSAAFVPIFNLLGLHSWGWIMVLVTTILCWASITRNADLARISIVLSAMITAVMAAGLWIGLGFMWSRWYSDVGYDVFWTLIWSHDTRIPAHVVALSLIVPPSPVIAIWATAFVIKDFVMCAQPLCVPLEERVGDVIRLEA